MDKNNLGPLGQKGYSQMGDGHSRGAGNIKADGDFAKPKNENWKDYVLIDKGNGRPKPAENSINKEQNKNKEVWKEKLLASKNTQQAKPTVQIKQVAKAQPAITKSR